MASNADNLQAALARPIKNLERRLMLFAAPMTPHTEVLVLLVGTLVLLSALTIHNFLRQRSRQVARSKRRQN
ncbi:hypothetical protein KW789_01120 [Candidatus Saccharibacteria bacterium]|nr:hypothetical protein [Candidatus Saccharibacteria bacterium]